MKNEKENENERTGMSRWFNMGKVTPSKPENTNDNGVKNPRRFQKRLSSLLAGGVSGTSDGMTAIERGISDLDNMSVVCALFLTIFAGFSASVNREELDRVPEGKYLQAEFVRKFWLENFYGVAMAVFSMCFCFALRTSLYLSANVPTGQVNKQLEKWDSMFIWDVFLLRIFVIAEAILVARVSGYLYSIKNPYDDLNNYGHTFTTVCGYLLIAYLLGFCFRHMSVVGAMPSFRDIMNWFGNCFKK